jgi:hypothetical protein
MSAAATLAREMASPTPAKRASPSVANFAMLAQARLWQAVARGRAAPRRPPADRRERACSRPIIAFGETGQYQKVGELYGELSELPLEEARRNHYVRATSRYAGATRISPSTPRRCRRTSATRSATPRCGTSIWSSGSSRAARARPAGDVILDPLQWSDVTRRRAVLARLAALALEAQLASEAPPDQAATVGLAGAVAEQLSQVELYSILSPLEHLYRRPEPAIRLVVVRALSRFLFKRTFITLRAAAVRPRHVGRGGGCAGRRGAALPPRVRSARAHLP